MDKEGSVWKSRGYLPHYDEKGCYQSITFRLIDSVPQRLIKQFREELDQVDQKFINFEMQQKIEGALSKGMGACSLQYDELAVLMEETLLRFDSERYDLIAWCIMPNHVHVLIKTKANLSKIVQSWKSYVGKYALKNKEKFDLATNQKEFWLREYWDRYIRDENHLLNTINYIHQNPVKAKLCERRVDWRWSSSYEGR